MFAEQCIGRTFSSSGIAKFIIENTVFLISPEYWEPAMIAKTLSFIQDGRAVLILADGLARIDNHKYKERFGCKARMIPSELVEPLIGHDIGGVCPFGVHDNVTVYLDESLKRHEIIYPAAGSDPTLADPKAQQAHVHCGQPSASGSRHDPHPPQRVHAADSAGCRDD